MNGCSSRMGNVMGWEGPPPPGWSPGKRPPCASCGAGSGEPCRTPAPSWETPRDFVLQRWGDGAPIDIAMLTMAVRHRDAAMLDVLQACMVPGNDYGTVENIRGVMAALRGERR